jgi:membrane-associated phospholipid phosphatase
MHLSLLMAGLLVASPGGAFVPTHSEPLPQRAESSAAHPLRFNWARDGAITAAGAALFLGSDALFKERLAPPDCRWCDVDGAGRLRLNPVDSFGRRLGARTAQGRASASQWSDVLGFGLVPVGVLGMQYGLARSAGGGMSLFAQDAFIILQSAVLSGVATNVVKFAVGRQRPFVHGLDVVPGADSNLSFYSGHTALAFSLAVSAGTVAELRGYEKSWLVWAVGMPLAAGVPLLRMRADKHYLTDVMAGALMGSAFGVGVPLLLHGRQSFDDDGGGGGLGSQGGGVRLRVSPLPTGVSLNGTF